MQRLPVIGLCRFSLVIHRSLRWFISTRDLSFEEAQRKVYDRDRMNLRLQVFEGSCLPSFHMLHEAWDQSIGIVLVSKTMPDEWKDRLRALIATRKGVKLHELDDNGDYSRDLRTLAAAESGGQRFYSYRIDDDDALSPDYVKEVVARDAEIPDGGVLSCTNGLQMARYGEDRFRVTHRRYPLNAQGMGVYSGPPKFDTMLHMGKHTAIGERAPVTEEEGSPKWLRVVHADNDSRTGFIKSPDFTLSEAAAFVGEWFPHIGEHELSLIPVRDTYHPPREPGK
jgi:hypothetical protein